MFDFSESQNELSKLREDAAREILARPNVWADIGANSCIILLVAADEAEILTIAVTPSVRRQGLARTMLRRAGQEARARGAVRVFLEVAADNAAARGLYWREGFREVGRRKAYYLRPDKRVDALVLALAL